VSAAAIPLAVLVEMMRERALSYPCPSGKSSPEQSMDN